MSVQDRDRCEQWICLLQSADLEEYILWSDRHPIRSRAEHTEARGITRHDGYHREYQHAPPVTLTFYSLDGSNTPETCSIQGYGYGNLQLRMTYDACWTRYHRIRRFSGDRYRRNYRRKCRLRQRI